MVSDDMLMLGCNVNSGTHYARATDIRKENLVSLLFFLLTIEGFERLLDWSTKLAVVFSVGNDST